MDMVRIFGILNAQEIDADRVKNRSIQEYIKNDSRLKVSRQVIINNWKTWEGWNNSHKMLDEDIILTESPGVFESMRHNWKVRDISDSMSLIESKDLCGRVADLALTWRQILNEGLDGILPGEEPGRIFGRDLANAMVRMVYHRELLIRADHGGKTLVPYIETVAGNRLDFMDAITLCPQSVNYFGLAAQTLVPNVEAVPVKSFEVREKRAGSNLSLSLIVLSILLKLSAAPPTFIFRYLQILWEWASNRVSLRSKLSRHAFVFSENDMLLGVISGLIWNGCSISRIKPVIGNTLLSERIFIKNKLLEVTPLEMRKALEPVAQKVEDLTNCILLPTLRQMREMIKDEIKKYLTDGRSGIVISGSVVDPVKILMTRCFGETGLAFVQFQHGGIGLIDLYMKSQYFSDMAVCDGFVCFNSHERDFYRQLTGDHSVRFHIKGAVKEHRPIMRSVARWAGRRIFNVTTKEKLALYFPTRFKDGDVFANDVYDMKYWRWMKTLLKEGVSNTACRFVVKVHQKRLWEFGEPTIYRERKDPLKEIAIGDNIEIHNYPQLNYCRFGADIILIDRATSTIGWAMAAEVPLLYIEMPFCRLLPSVRRHLKDAIFYIDGTKPNWTNLVRDMLNTPKKELRVRYEKKRNSRVNFSERYILGPQNGYKGFWSWFQSVQPIHQSKVSLEAN